MKVLDQLVFLGQLHNLTASVATQRARTWCDRLQIADVMDKRTEELSKGMQQKIQFIASLLHEPDLIIMDEPFSGLDPVNATLLMDTLLDLRSQGKAILFSTHRMDQVEKLCDEIAIIYQGRLVLEGSMRTIKSRYPANRVHVHFSGDAAFLNHPLIADAKNYSGLAEIILADTPDCALASQQILALALQNGTTITRYEVIEPTLEEIFIETVGENVDA